MPRSTLSPIWSLLLVIELVPGCATVRSAPLDELRVSTSALAEVRRSRDVLDSQEINARGAHTAYDAIVRFRPEFLKRAPGDHVEPDPVSAKRRSAELLDEIDAQFPTVFLNGIRQAGPAALRTIPASGILEIRYYRAMATPAKYGFNNPLGVIEVRTAL